MTQTTATLIAAVISSAVAILAVVFRDIILDDRKETRRLRRELIEKKLTEIYSPLWVAAGGGESLNLLGSKTIRARMEGNFHLLSPAVQDILNKLLAEATPTDSGQAHISSESGHKLILDLYPKLIGALKADLHELQQEYSLISRRAPRRFSTGCVR